MEELTKTAVETTGLRGRGVLRSKNFFALGLLSWMFNRPLDPVFDWVTDKYGDDDPVGNANIAAFRAGYNFGITTEEFHHTFEVQPARLPAGTYTNVTGNQALAWGLIAAAQSVRLPLFYGSYPITPASGILEELVPAQELRGAHRAGRGRDRRRRHRPRRLVRRPPRRHRHQRPR